MSSSLGTISSAICFILDEGEFCLLTILKTLSGKILLSYSSFKLVRHLSRYIKLASSLSDDYSQCLNNDSKCDVLSALN